MQHAFNYSVSETDIPMTQLSQLIAGLDCTAKILHSLLAKESKVHHDGEITKLSDCLINGGSTLDIVNDFIPTSKLSPVTDNMSALELLGFNLKRTEIAHELSLNYIKEAKTLRQPKSWLGKLWAKVTSPNEVPRGDIFNSDEVVKAAKQYLDSKPYKDGREMAAVIAQYLLDRSSIDVTVSTTSPSHKALRHNELTNAYMVKPAIVSGVVVQLHFFDTTWYNTITKKGTVLNNYMKTLDNCYELLERLNAAHNKAFVNRKEEGIVINGDITRAKEVLETIKMREEFKYVK